MYRLSKPAVMCLAAIVFLSCSVAPKLTKKEKDLVQKNPAPYSRVSPFYEALKNFERIIVAYGISSELVVQGKVIDNKTACETLPLDITDMIKTAFNSIGENVRYAPFDPEYIIMETQTGSSTIGRKLPEIVVEGAITECDEDLNREGSNVEANGKFGGGDWETEIGSGVNKELSYSRIALDLHLMEYETNLLIPHKQTSIAVDVWQISKKRFFEFTLHGSGLGIDGHIKMAQGKHDAVRALAELSVLQLLGKYYELPYWRCLEGAKEDQEVISLIKKRFNRLAKKEKITQIQTLLAKHGYDVSLTGKIDIKTQKAIKSFADKDNGLKKGAQVADLYTSLYITLPLSSVDTISNLQSGKTTGSKNSIGVDPSALNLQTAIIYTPTGSNRLNILKKGDTLKSGDDYKLIIMPEEDCFLYLFQVDGAGNLFMLFPLANFKDAGAGSANPLSGHNRYMLPSKNSAFFLDENRGIEKVYLLASREADKNIERLHRLLETSKDPKDREKVREVMLQYIQSKEVIEDAITGDTIMLEDESNSNKIILTKLSDFSRDQIYVMKFRHE